MDFLPDIETISAWLSQYGSIALFGLLILGIVAFPVPEETMMVVAGILMYEGTLPIAPTLLAAYAGSISGITISYFVGRTFGRYLIHRWGKQLGITDDLMEKMHRWFERFGIWMLLIGYFIPGVRHFTGFSAGFTYLHFGSFALFAYLGALIWVSTFLSIGYFFGSYWVAAFEKIFFDTETLIIILLLIVLCYAIYYLKKHHF